ncbi:hypothetical protein JCM19233_5530 [Vibrio astriarenae]|nr:hypothetical protein JCM19233_5530 [Vibrio sp. C7]
MVNSTPYVFAVGNLYNEDDVKIDVPKDTVTELSTFLPGESVTVPSSSIGWVNAINDYGRIKKFKIGVN